MKDLTKWVIVFGAGMLAYSWFVEPKAKPAKSPVMEASTEPTSKESKSRKPSALLPAPKIVTRIAKPVKTEKLNVVTPQKPKEILNLSLSESIISQMEYDWNELPVQAEARRESRGWRFTRINGSSNFYRAGFREGDLVTTEFLETLRNIEEKFEDIIIFKSAR